MCQPLGIAAWIMGNGDLKQMNAGSMDPEGRSMTNAGRICGMIASCILILAVLFYLVVVVIGVGAAVASNG